MALTNGLSSTAAKRRTIQFSVVDSIKQGRLVPSAASTLDGRLQELEALRKRMNEVDPNWPMGWNLRAPPCQIYMPQEEIRSITAVQKALSKSIVSIVNRWFKDEVANFPSRMPIQPREERILRWIDGEGSRFVSPYNCHQGTWRPDFLFEAVPAPDGTMGERIVICEINSRLPYNGFIITPNSAHVYESYDLAKAGLKFGLDRKKLFKNLFSVFDTSKPVHAVQDSLHSEITHISETFTRMTGQPFRIIKPTDFRLVPDASSPTGYGLWCISKEGADSEDLKEVEGETLEPVHQVTANLYQHEYAGWEFEMMREVAMRCAINDFRSVFLANDQRLLGIVLEELDDLVSVQKAITNDEAQLLQQRLIPTFANTSRTFEAILKESRQDATYKDLWMLKAARGGMSGGHTFGHSVSNEDWIEKLTQITESQGVEEGAYCLQKVVNQPEYDIIRHEFETVEKFHLVGTYLCVNGVFQGLGPVRIARDICVHISDPAQKGVVLSGFTDADAVN